ncbi:hypothetical protein ALC56_08125, partial [Trachymyrmex septentrionalis]
QRIRNVFRSITSTVLNRVRNSFHKRLRLCIQQEIESGFHVIFKRLSKVKPMVPFYSLLEIIQLLSETFSCKIQGKGNIWDYRLK